MFLTMLMVFLESEVMQRKVKKVRQEDEKEEADVPEEKVEVMTEGQRRNPSNSTTTSKHASYSTSAIPPLPLST